MLCLWLISANRIPVPASPRSTVIPTPTATPFTAMPTCTPLRRWRAPCRRSGPRRPRGLSHPVRCRYHRGHDRDHGGARGAVRREWSVACRGAAGPGHGDGPALARAGPVPRVPDRLRGRPFPRRPGLDPALTVEELEDAARDAVGVESVLGVEPLLIACLADARDA